MTAIPDFLRNKALSRGVPEDEVPDLWDKHVEWCESQGKMAGGHIWDALVSKYIERIRDQKALDDKESRWAEERARKLKAERRAKAASDAEYERQAVSLGDWLASLRAAAADGELLVPHERVMAHAEAPRSSSDVGSWMMGALRGLPPVERPNPCGEVGCGLPVERWVGTGGRVYTAGRCVDHRGAREERR